jgi:hypothetical protein
MVVVVGVDVAPRAVRLPDLDYGAGHRRTVFVHHAQPQMHQLPDGLLVAMAGDVAAQQLHALCDLGRAGELGERGRAPHQRLFRVAPGRLRIAGDDARRLRALVPRLDHDLHR